MSVAFKQLVSSCIALCDAGAIGTLLSLSVFAYFCYRHPNVRATHHALAALLLLETLHFAVRQTWLRTMLSDDESTVIGHSLMGIATNLTRLCLGLLKAGVLVLLSRSWGLYSPRGHGVAQELLSAPLLAVLAYQLFSGLVLFSMEASGPHYYIRVAHHDPAPLVRLALVMGALALAPIHRAALWAMEAAPASVGAAAPVASDGSSGSSSRVGGRGGDADSAGATEDEPAGSDPYAFLPPLRCLHVLSNSVTVYAVVTLLVAGPLSFVSPLATEVVADLTNYLLLGWLCFYFRPAPQAKIPINLGHTASVTASAARTARKDAARSARELMRMPILGLRSVHGTIATVSQDRTARRQAKTVWLPFAVIYLLEAVVSLAALSFSAVGLRESAAAWSADTCGALVATCALGAILVDLFLVLVDRYVYGSRADGFHAINRWPAFPQAVWQALCAGRAAMELLAIAARHFKNTELATALSVFSFCLLFFCILFDGCITFGAAFLCAAEEEPASGEEECERLTKESGSDAVAAEGGQKKGAGQQGHLGVDFEGSGATAPGRNDLALDKPDSFAHSTAIASASTDLEPDAAFQLQFSSLAHGMSNRAAAAAGGALA